MGPDYDDVGAMTLLHAFADSGYINILSTVASTKYEGVAAVFNLLNTYFKRPDILIGVPKGKALELKDNQHWTDSILQNYPHKIKKNDEVLSATEVYRKSLASQADNSVTIITVGFLTNLADLLRSPPDKYSRLNGKELVNKKVKQLVCMAGGFPAGNEFNVRMDAAASQYVFTTWPTQILLTGVEIGFTIKTGLPLVNNNSIQNNPVKDVYRISIPLSQQDTAGRMSWDQTAVLIAVKGHKPWWKVEKGKMLVAGNGSNTWTKQSSLHSYIVEEQPPSVVQELINKLMMHQPVNTNPTLKEGFAGMKDGARIFYKIFGNRGDTIILLHGGPGQNMYGIGPDLEPLGRNHVLIMYDQRGSGNSETGPDTITAATHVEDLENFRQYFHLTKMILAGQSWGAMLATLYTSSYAQHVERLLFISPGPPTRKLFDARFAAFSKKDSVGQARVRYLRSQLTGSAALAVCEEVFLINDRFYIADKSAIKRKKGNYCSVTADAIRKQAITAASTLRSLGDYDLRPLCSLINQPVLLVEGALSPVPTHEMEIWKNSLPNCRTYLFKKSGHGYPFVEEPELFFRVVEEFLNKK